MNAVEIAAIVASIVGAILAVVAIAQAVYFYTQTKGSEARVENALTGIKEQTEALKAISGRQLDRLTKYATAPREEHPHAGNGVRERIPFLTIRRIPRETGSGETGSGNEIRS